MENEIKVEKSLSDKLVCKICGREFKNFLSLAHHICQTHKNQITTKEYYDKYLKKEKEGLCLECEKNSTFISLKKGYCKFCSTKCVANSKEVKEEKIQTNQRNRGTNYPSQSKEVVDKYKHSIKENNIKDLNRLKKIKEKKRLLYQKHYGKDNPMQNEEVKEKYKKTSKNNCGKDHWSKTEEGLKLHRLKCIEQVETQKLNNEPLMPNIGPQERECLNEFQKHIPFKIIRNDHNIAIKIGRFPDGHVIEIRLFINFDEWHHFLDKEQKIYNKDSLKCTVQLESLNYTVFRVSEFDWKNNREKVIKEFKLLVQCLIEKFL